MIAPEWKFRQFRRSQADTPVIKEWYTNATSEAKAGFRVTMSFLKQRPMAEWARPAQKPRYKPLSHDLHGYSEIRFFANGIQHRPIGCFTGRNEFTILIFAIEQGSKFYPRRKALVKILDERSRLIQENKEQYSNEWQVY